MHAFWLTTITTHKTGEGSCLHYSGISDPLPPSCLQVTDFRGRVATHQGDIPSMGLLGLLEIQMLMTWVEGQARLLDPIDPTAARQATKWDSMTVRPWHSASHLMIVFLKYHLSSMMRPIRPWCEAGDRHSGRGGRDLKRWGGLSGAPG
jgi:hypothetical protein